MACCGDGRKGNRPRSGAFGTALSSARVRLPDPLPPRFTAALVATVRCTVEHALLDDGRAEVEEAGVAFEAHVDGAAVRVAGFPEIEATVGTTIGQVRCAVTVDGELEGDYDAATGHASVNAELSFSPKSLFASTSRVAVRLETKARLADPKAKGDPLDAGDDRVTLVGEGTFSGGSLDGGHLGLVLDCRIKAVE